MMVQLSSEFTPAHLQGITIHPENALQFDFLIHRGDEKLSEVQKKEQYGKLVKYFLASLTIPDEDQWVNLSPYEKDRIIKDNFGTTEMGRDLLTQDYILKQITSSLIYPEKNLGKKFWDKIYERAWKEFHTTTIGVNTFNKVWIIPDQAAVYESGNTCYVLKNHLKVMLEEDYLSMSKHSDVGVGSKPTLNRAGLEPAPTGTNQLGSLLAKNILQEIILPELEREVNEGKNFANLRQIYSGMILATWYKKTLKESLLGKVYADKAKTKGVDQNPKANEIIYQQYLKAFKKGVFNYIKEDMDKYTKERVPRKYFSGGMQDFAQITKDITKGFQDRAVVVLTPDNISKAARWGMDFAALADSSRIDQAVIVLSTSKDKVSISTGESSLPQNKTADEIADFYRINLKESERKKPRRIAEYERDGHRVSMFLSFDQFQTDTLGIERSSTKEGFFLTVKVDGIYIHSDSRQKYQKSSKRKRLYLGDKRNALYIIWFLNRLNQPDMVSKWLDRDRSTDSLLSQSQSGFNPYFRGQTPLFQTVTGREEKIAILFRNLQDLYNNESKTGDVGDMTFELGQSLKEKLVAWHKAHLNKTFVELAASLESNNIASNDLEALELSKLIRHDEPLGQKDIMQSRPRADVFKIIGYIETFSDKAMIMDANVNTPKLPEGFVRLVSVKDSKEVGKPIAINDLERGIKILRIILKKKEALDNLDALYTKWQKDDSKKDTMDYQRDLRDLLRGSNKGKAYRISLEGLTIPDQIRDIVLTALKIDKTQEGKPKMRIIWPEYTQRELLQDVREHDYYGILSDETLMDSRFSMKNFENLFILIGQMFPISSTSEVINIIRVASEELISTEFYKTYQDTYSLDQFLYLIPAIIQEDSNSEKDEPIAVTKDLNSDYWKAKRLEIWTRGIKNPSSGIRGVIDSLISHDHHIFTLKRLPQNKLDKEGGSEEFNVSTAILATAKQPFQLRKVPVVGGDVKQQRAAADLIMKNVSEGGGRFQAPGPGSSAFLPIVDKAMLSDRWTDLNEMALVTSSGHTMVEDREIYKELKEVVIPLGMDYFIVPSILKKVLTAMINPSEKISFDPLHKNGNRNYFRFLTNFKNAIRTPYEEKLYQFLLEGGDTQIALDHLLNNLQNNKESVLISTRSIIRDPEAMLMLCVIILKSVIDESSAVDRKTMYSLFQEEGIFPLALILPSVVDWADRQKVINRINRSYVLERKSFTKSEPYLNDDLKQGRSNLFDVLYKSSPKRQRSLFVRTMQRIHEVESALIRQWQEEEVSESDIDSVVNQLSKDRYSSIVVLKEEGILPNDFTLSKEISSDKAMGSKKSLYGGIDMNSVNLTLEIKRDGKGVPLPLALQDMAQLSRIEGFIPEIIEIKPAVGLPIFSELRQKLQSIS
ncbi:MAG: hypothetical protein HQL15_06515 [Candidatus Omnitrophica bacterium]|nr:hypothetical protein [Candidatus Omnitrophota bacterium]